MTPADAARVLAKAAAFDQRTVGAADVAAWHEAIGDLDLDEALRAVTAHYRATRDRLMPSDLIALVHLARRERHRADREAAEARALEAAEATERGTLVDHREDLRAFVHAIRDALPEGNPDSLRWGHRQWREHRTRQQRLAAAEPNPHYRPAALAEAARMAEQLDDPAA